MKTILSLILLISLPYTYLQTALAKEKDPINIAFVFDGSNSLNKIVLKLVKQEISELTKAEFDINFPEHQIFECDWKIDIIESVITRILADEDVDFIITLGAVCSDIISKQDTLQKPVIAPFIVDAKIQGLYSTVGKKRIVNLNYIEVPFTTSSTLQDFKSLAEFENLAIIYSDFYISAIPKLVEKTNNIAENLGIKTYSYRVKNSISKVIENLSTEIEAVYLSPLLELGPEEYKKLILELNRRKLPSFSIMGLNEVKNGVLATNRSNLFPRIARRIALNFQRILLGDKAEEINSFFTPSENLTINMKTARDIEIYPKWNILIEADLINEEETETGKSLDLKTVMNQVVKNNLDFLSQKKNVSASSENINIAQSNLLPQIDISATGLLIDRDRAESSFGSQPEKTITGSITATQLIYSEPAWANLSIQSSLQKTKEFELKQLQLDISLLAAQAFLNVLKAKTFEKIQKNNLKRTKSNLEIARVRESVGSAGPAEVYRWESELASNRNSVIQTIAQVNLARIELNRILNRNLEEKFICIESNIYSESLLNSQNTLPRYLGNPYSFNIFKEFMVKEGLRNSPELIALNSAIEAQEMLLTSSTNKYWAPTLALRAEYSNLFWKNGAGSNLPTTIDDHNWNIALSLSFPIFDGTEKYALRRQAQETLDELKVQYKSISEKVEQQIRSRLYIVGASFAAIRELKLSAEAAAKSLKVVQDSYALGAVSILDLLDAQNAALVSEQLTSNSTFDFTNDLMTMERAVGKFYLQLSDKEVIDFLRRLEDFYTEKKTLKTTE